MSILDRLFGPDVYIQVFMNRVVVRNLTARATFEKYAVAPFSTSRLLVGNFDSARHTLQAAFRELATGKLVAFSPRALVHAMQMSEGGLSQVEERVLLELAEASGARSAKSYQGPALSDDAALELLQ